MSCKRAVNQETGFTIIELMVTISILVILVSILLPSLTKSRESTRRIKCTAQLRTLQQVTVDYSMHHKGNLPDLHNASGEWADNASTSPYWYSVAARDMLLDSYTLSRADCYCPSNQEGWNRDDFWDWPGGKSSVWGYMYFGAAEENYNSTGTWVFSEPVTDPVFSEKYADDPHEKVVFTDLNRELGAWSWFGTNRVGSNHFNGDNPVGSNEIFADGHVEWVPWASMDARMTNGTLLIYW